MWNKVEEEEEVLELTGDTATERAGDGKVKCLKNLHMAAFERIGLLVLRNHMHDCARGIFLDRNIIR